MKEKNRDSRSGIYRTEAKRRKGSKSPDAVVSRGERDTQRTVLGAKGSAALSNHELRLSVGPVSV